MREIKFRGRKSNGEWVYGDLVTTETTDGIPTKKQILPFDAVLFENTEEVEEDTIGQFTGLHDQNGKEIYEGDVIKQYLVVPNYRNARRGQVLFDKLWCFVLLSEGRLYHLFGDGIAQEVQGNIHDNPNLLTDGRD